MRIGKIDGNFVVNPVRGATSPRASDLDLIVAGTDEAILMVEAGANEIPEAEILDALDIAHDEIKKLCALQRELRREGRQGEDRGRGRRRSTTSSTSRSRPRTAPTLDAATQVEDKLERQDATKAVEDAGRSSSTPATPTRRRYAEQRRPPSSSRSTSSRRTIIRERIAVQKSRPDGRAADEIRPISIEVGVAPRTHGSALFTRGQTQALSVAALGTHARGDAARHARAARPRSATSTTTTSRPSRSGRRASCAGPKRRDIGHGALAERALVPMIPSIEDFPYTIRVVSDILESNGSSSMASVCGSSLSLMDAGVPIKRAGRRHRHGADQGGRRLHRPHRHRRRRGPPRRHGLQGRRHRRTGITALQMDIKITGVTFDILRDALTQAHEARTFILGKMAEVDRRAARGAVASTRRASPRSRSTPRRSACVIGKGGETIRGLSDEFEAQIDVNDEGQVLVYAASGEQGDALADRIRTMTKEVEVGDAFAGKVVKTTTFGAFVELAKGTDGLLHISNISPGQRIDTVEDVLNKGDEVEVTRGRGRPRARPHRPAPRRRSRRRRASRSRSSQRSAAATAARAAAAAGTAAAGAAVAATGTAIGPRGSGRPRHRDPDRA